MNGSDHADSFVTLRSGLVLPIQAILLALDLESRGLRLEVDGDAVVVVGLCDRLTDEDRQHIRRWREHLKSIATYTEDQTQ